MPLNSTTADAAAVAFLASIGVTDPVATAKWKALMEQLYTSLKADILITILSGSVVTTGSATTQAGPAAPIPLHPA